MTVLRTRLSESPYRQLAALIAVTVPAACLRFYGLRWGLPNNVHDYSYHPDEFLVVGASFGRVLGQRTFDPGFYNYPSLYIYLCAAAIAAAFAYGAAGVLANVYLAARSVTAAMGTAAVAATCWAGRVSFGPGVGLTAALILCVAPIHAQHSHFATVDVPSTLFVAACLGFAGLVFREGLWKHYLLAGAMAGLAAGTKYNAGLVLLSLVAAHLLRGGGVKAVFGGRIWGAIGCTALSFVVSTPGAVLRPESFWHGFSYELRHASTGHGLVFVGTGSGFIYTLTNSLWYGLGPLALPAVPAVLFGLWKRDKRVLAILAFVVPYYILISISQVRFARYALPIFPGIAIVTAWFIEQTLAAARNRVRRAVWLIACGAIGFWSLAAVLVWTALFGLTDPRDQAARWVRKNIPKGASIGVIEVPWFYSPPLSKNLGFGPLALREAAMNEGPYRLVRISPSGSSIPNWAIVSDFETRDALRLRGKPNLSPQEKQQKDAVLSRWELVSRCARARAYFGPLPALLRLIGFSDPPHDMRYVRPLITVYERKQ